MKNPFKSDHPDPERDNPLVPNAIERPVERASGRADGHDNPLVPNAIERPVERASGRAAGDDNPLVPNAIERPVERATADERGGVARPAVDSRDRFDDRRDDQRFDDSPTNIARGRAGAGRSMGDRLPEHDGPGHPPPSMAHPSDNQGAVTTSGIDQSTQVDLFPKEELVGYRTQWESIQAGFVDQPRAAVERADALVSQLATRLTEVFTRERSTLEEQWTKGDNVSTEELRIALTRYRTFFHRLLSM
jgi:hypothetical protein